MTLHLTRHGQVDQKTDHPVGDPHLSPLGREQARLLGERLRALGFSGRIFSSPYMRTIETANIVAEVAGASVIPAPEMREYVIRDDQMDSFKGLTLSELADRYSRVDGDMAFDYPWWTSEIETQEIIEARVKPLVDRVSKSGEDALLVGHGASVGGVHGYILGKHAPDRLGSGEPGWNCVLSSFQFEEEFKLIRLLDTEHLPEDHVTSNAKTRAEVLKERAERIANERESGS
jgi:broad specificity phosphatase PhoE